MNKSKQMLEDDARFDRLVDGELPAEEYKALLAALDDEPGGWRRCAAAFLEAQALGCELGTIRSQVQPKGSLPQPVAPAKQGGWPRGNLLLAMSASFLVAFILGVSLPDLWNLGSNAPLGGPPIAGQPAFETDRGEFPRAVGNARLVFDGPDGAQSTIGGVPIYEDSGDADRWLGQSQPALPVELVNELRRRGHRVRRDQQVVPVNLEDGRSGLIPVESYQITPVSRRAY